METIACLIVKNADWCTAFQVHLGGLREQCSEWSNNLSIVVDKAMIIVGKAWKGLQLLYSGWGRPLCN